MTLQDKYAYIAGYFDAEGSIAFTNGQHGWSRSIQIVNTAKKTIIWVKNLLGGHVYHSKTRKGSLGKKPVFVWKVYSFVDIQYFLETIGPFVKQKKHDIKVMAQQLHGNVSYAEAKRRTRKR